jgi:hypothetical protein
MTCQNCKKLERENKQLREKAENMEKARKFDADFIESLAARYRKHMAAIIDKADAFMRGEE